MTNIIQRRRRSFPGKRESRKFYLHKFHKESLTLGINNIKKYPEIQIEIASNPSLKGGLHIKKIISCHFVGPAFMAGQFR